MLCLELDDILDLLSSFSGNDGIFGSENVQKIGAKFGLEKIYYRMCQECSKWLVHGLL